jgi:predicted DCC family thiol-disulfide oxidoreductase YuxK
MSMTSSAKLYRYSSWHFALFRILFGLYLAIHFWDLVAYAPEIWSGAGNLGDPSILPTYGMFPNILFWFTSPAFARGFLWFLVFTAALFTIGAWRRIAALVLWYGWACLAGRNPFIANPGLPFIGLLLLVCAITPYGEPFAVTKGKDGETWRMPEGLYEGIWIIMALGYTVSGIHKCMSPSWADGTAIVHLLNNPLSRDNSLRQMLLSMPEILLKLNTWGVLALEVLFAPLCYFAFTRKWTWLAMIGMHCGIVSLVNFADLTIGVLMVHLFTFDDRWLPGKKTEQSPVLFFDGVCGLCNGFIQFLFDVDEQSVFKVATLQGAFAAEKLPDTLTKNLNSLVVMTDEGTLLTKSRAVLFVMTRVGGLWRVVGIAGNLVPARVTDIVYDLVAKNRYHLFGKLESCRMPTPSERSRFVG